MRHGLISTTTFFNVAKSVGGFPLALNPRSPTTVEQDSKLKMLRWVIFSCLNVAIYVFLVYETRKRYGTEPLAMMGELAKAHGTSMFQIWVLVTTTYWTALSISFALWIIICRRKEICKMYGEIKRMETRLGLEQTFSKSHYIGRGKMVAWSVITISLITLGSFAYSAARYIAYKEYSGDERFTWDVLGYFIAMVWDRIWLVCNPILSVATLICIDCTSAISDLFIAWRDTMDTITTKEQDSVCSRLRTHILFGKELCKLVEDVSEVLAPFFLYLHGHHLLGGITYCYGACDIIFTNSPKTSAILLCIVFVIFATTSFYGLGLMAHCSTLVMNERDQAITALDSHFIDNEDVVPNKLINTWTGTVRSQLASKRLTAYNYFEVSNQGFLTLIGTVITYLIIVLQFRSG